MPNDYKDYHVIASASGILHSNRAGDRHVEIPRDLPGIVIFIHGVNDPGAVYETVEAGLNQGINERLSRSDLNKGEYGGRYKAVKKLPKERRTRQEAKVLYDPEMYLYQRRETPGITRSGFIPFYWGYRAASDEIAKVNDAGIVKSTVADANGNLMTRGQYQDKKGNRLDAHFAKPGGFFANATNNIPDMYGAGFRADWAARKVTEHAAAGNYTYAADGPERRYFILAAHRLASLIATIREIKPTAVAESHGLNPKHETITVIGHSQGTIITLLAQAILVQQGKRCIDSFIMVDTPYSLYDTDKCSQTARAKLKTLVDIVNEITKAPYTIPELAEMLVDHEKHGGRSGAGWSPKQGKRLDKSGKNWITFDERDNRGKVYLYFCPEDTVVGLKDVRGIGTFGVPDTVPGDVTDQNKKPPAMPAMDALKGKRFFQRMWTRMERDSHGDGKFKRVPVGTAPARVPVRTQYERLKPGPEAGRSMGGSAAAQAKNALLQANFTRDDMRFINGEELKPPCEPELYGGEVLRGGPRPGHADVAGEVAPDDVSQSVALGNQYASFQWITVATGFGVADVEKHKRAFNEQAGDDINNQAHNWRSTVDPRSSHYRIEREETPNEARERMARDPAARDENNYHSAVLAHTENHRWVTAMDVALGQAITMDDPVWRDLLIRMADWKLDRRAEKGLRGNTNFGRLSPETRKLLEACVDYYQHGVFPDSSLVPMTPPPLVTSELKQTVRKELDQQLQERAAAEARLYQQNVDWSQLSNMRW
ncbi:T6SS effector phospholipase Tle3 domain-containing protein [Ralstonia pseudosolanacearum]|uniref:Putative transmembrane protein n=1 Tax=Ralstonia solanacearum TaxID=305 RepID=A0A0S4WBF9_RALSL|nr:DUF3274 domain-containing protein [Ralstonia pseudosolanacearum]CUV44069.1 putative transmembrane protein [Ralstonia solanacearum]MDO3509513.1 DUF3274 domain-containing protein [Ralstonia pseudosolanacearum]MDO3539454.1 DUF3274 domain-containing protein [Ralstonia pseudosolanacearum]MDO3563507.1 DUF3274 domain-containing protein [Ralstonia pseudosolanacearum]MDO3573233.1 DUF3274 domain-containing protein [Ralstonia pseudosolanacearum]